MKSLVKKILTFLLFVVLLSCSKDEPNPIDPTPPVVTTPPTDTNPSTDIKPTTPVSSLMKPAIRNIKSSSITSKSSEVRKRVVKSINFPNTTVNVVYKYNLAIDIEDYKKLPTDNLYDSREDDLNTNTIIEYSMDYLYNTDNQLTNIKQGYVRDITRTNPEELSFQYNSDGKLTDILTTYSFGGTYSYNASSLIDKYLDKEGQVRFTYEYDGLGRIVNSYYYESGQNKPAMHYTYDYPDNETYIKNWFAVSPSDGTETKTSFVLYKYDSSKPGVYNKEPYYRLDNKYMHIVQFTGYILYQGQFVLQQEIRPKYFYDADGYLIKYDSAGLNQTVDIIKYKYE